MKRILTSLATVAVATVASGGLLVGLASSASAAGTPPWEPDPSSVGGLTFYDASGNQILGGSVTSQPIAAYVEGGATIRSGDTKATLYAYLPVNGTAIGKWSGEALGASTTYPNASAPGALAGATLPVETGGSGDLNIADIESDFPNTDTSTDGYAGMYQLRLKTSAAGLSATTSYDSADIQITGTGASATWAVVYPATSLTATTTTLVATPASPQPVGTDVTLMATVSPAAPGTVQFNDGSTPIGSPVTVTGGTAATNDAGLSVGGHTLSAVFTPATGSVFSGSTGTTSYTVQAGPAAVTSTALAGPSTATEDTSVSFTATVTTGAAPGTPVPSGAGQVEFFSTDSSNTTIQIDKETVGTGGVANGSYSSFATGAYTITAKFVPTDPTVYDASTTVQGITFTATAAQNAPDPQTIDVNIPSGTLTITTPYTTTNPFSLGTAALDPSGAKFTASGAFGSGTSPATGNDGGVTVTDTRSGGQPWTASATVTNFTDTASDVINGENLTFTGVKAEYYTGNALQSPDVVTTDVTNSAIYGPTDPGTDGLKGGPHEFATAADGAGTVNIDGTLTLTAPSSTPTGSYSATLTFTIV